MKAGRNQPNPLKKKVMTALTEVLDPELHISIVDLGLIYDVTIDSKKKAHITMTLTTIGCPLFNVIEQEMQNKLYQIGLNDVSITLTFDPPWSMEKLSEGAKAKLGI